MRDRTPTKVLDNGALRYGVYDEAGNFLRYEYLGLADEPTDPGTDLSKQNLLQDTTEASLFGSAADRTIDDTFAGIAGLLKLIKDDMAIVNLTLTDSAGKPLPEVLVQGILSETGAAVYTNSSGLAAGYIGGGSQTIKISGYADIEDYSETINVVKGTTINKTVTLTTRNFFGVTSSNSLKFSGNVSTIDYSVTSGGGGGGGGDGDSSRYTYGGAGGSGSGTITKMGIEVTPNKAYPAVIGAGGAGGLGHRYNHASTDGSAGGKSSFMGTTINGGNGGKRQTSQDTSAESGGGIGGGGGCVVNSSATAQPPKAGGDATSAAFTSFTGTSNLGGGGAGGSAYLNNYAEGGKIGGGRGGHKQDSGAAGTANTGGGGGGGGNGGTTGSDDDPNGYGGGTGGSGYIGIRMHLKSAA